MTQVVGRHDRRYEAAPTPTSRPGDEDSAEDSTDGIPAFFKISSAMSTAAVAMDDADAIDGLGEVTRPAATEPATLASSSLRLSIVLVVSSLKRANFAR